MILMIDNYDSFTYNVVQYFTELGEQVEVYIATMKLRSMKSLRCRLIKL